MKLQSFAEWLFSLLQAATAGCFAVLQRMSDFRSRTAYRATYILRQIYNEERVPAAALDLGRDAPDTPPHPLALLFNHGKKRSWEGVCPGAEVWTREKIVQLSENTIRLYVA